MLEDALDGAFFPAIELDRRHGSCALVERVHASILMHIDGDHDAQRDEGDTAQLLLQPQCDGIGSGLAQQACSMPMKKCTVEKSDAIRSFSLPTLFAGSVRALCDRDSDFVTIFESVRSARACPPAPCHLGLC